MKLRFDRRTVLAGLVFGIVAIAGFLAWMSLLGGVPGAIALIFPSLFLWFLVFAWIARRTLPRER